MKKAIQIVCVAALLVGLGSLASAAVTYTYSPIALSGQIAPDTGGRTYTGFTGRPLINNSGHVAFAAELSGNPTSNAGVWTGAQGSPELIVQTGEIAPGAPSGESFPGLSLSYFSDTGDVWFLSNLAPEDSTTGYSIWRGSAGGIEPVAIHGTPAYGLPDDIMFNTRSSRSLLVSRLGTVGLRTGLSGPDVDKYNDGGLWVDRPGSMELIAREGDQATGMPAGVVYRHFGITAVSVNASGQIAFNAHVFDGADPAWSAIWTGTPGATRIIAEEGTQAPGMPDGVTYGHPHRAQLNDSGMVTFLTHFQGSDALFGAYAGHSDDLRLLWYYGQQAPGLPAGVHFVGGSNPVISGNGEVAARVKLNGPGVDSDTDSTLWKGLPGNLQLIAREGDHPPGAPDGLVFSSGFEYQLNARGQILFSGRLAGGKDGIWATDATGQVQLIVLEGALFEVTPGDWREVSEVLASPPRGGGQDGWPIMINDNGHITFRAAFTDGTSGVFMAIPEPSSAVLLLLGLGAVIGRRRS